MPLKNKNVPILVYCRSQKRSTHALVVLRQLGYTEVYNLTGGILAYEAFLAEYPEFDPTNPGPVSPPEKDGPQILDDSEFGDC